LIETRPEGGCLLPTLQPDIVKVGNPNHLFLIIAADFAGPADFFIQIADEDDLGN
jgi:hypothetical protein